MMEQIKRFFAPPVFEDRDQNRQARLLNNVLWIAFALNLLGLLVSSIVAKDLLYLVIFVQSAYVVALFFLRRRALTVAGLIVPMVIFGGASYLEFFGHGLYQVGFTYMLVILAGSLFFGKPATLGFSALTIVTATVLALLEINGTIVNSFSPYTNSLDVFIIDGLLALAGVMLYALVDIFAQSQKEALENEHTILASNAELESIRRNLEGRVAERTRDLTLSAEIGRAVTQERKLDVLLPDAVERMREAFDLYYTQIYLTDPLERILILRAGSGAVGEQLLRRGHRLSIDYASINGSAAASKKAVLVENTAKSESFLPNPLLPKTRSEMAVPLLSGERVLGVLNMQSESPETFTQETLPAFEILAGQLTAAIENAYQFAETERVRAQVEAQSRFLTRQGWDSYLDAVRQPEFMGIAFQDGTVETLTTPADQLSGKSMVVPISVAGVEIGTIQLEKDGTIWTPEEQEIASRFAALAGQHMENLRLLTEAEVYRREAERAARRLAREGWDSYQQLANEPVTGYVYTNNRVKPLTQARDNEDESGTTFPLTVHGETIGTFELGMPKGSLSVHSEAAELVETITGTLSVHIENLRLAQATETALAQTETLYNLTTQLTKAETLEEVLQLVASTRPGGQSSLLTIEVDANGIPESLISTASWPPASSQGAMGVRYPIHNFPIAKLWISKPGEALLFGNIETDPRMDPQTRAINQQFGFKAAAYLPLKIGNTWVGLISVSWESPQVFTETDSQLYDAVTAQAAVVVNNRLLFGQSVKRAERESLINTINQRIQSATSVEGALETAAREMGHLLKVRRMVVEIGTTPQNGSKETI